MINIFFIAMLSYFDFDFFFLWRIDELIWNLLHSFIMRNYRISLCWLRLVNRWRRNYFWSTQFLIIGVVLKEIFTKRFIKRMKRQLPVGHMYSIYCNDSYLTSTMCLLQNNNFYLSMFINFYKLTFFICQCLLTLSPIQFT